MANEEGYVPDPVQVSRKFYNELLAEHRKLREQMGALLKLVEDGVLVRNTSGDDDMAKYLRDSTRLVMTLKHAQELL